MAADLTQGLRRSLRLSLMLSLTALRTLQPLQPYVVTGYWVDGYTVLD